MDHAAPIKPTCGRNSHEPIPPGKLNEVFAAARLADLEGMTLLSMREYVINRSSMDTPQFVYVTYIMTTPEKLWNALMDGEMTKQYWGRAKNVSDWKVGSTWQHQD